MESKVKYGTKEYNEAYINNQIANSYNKETDTYNRSLPEVVITSRNNLNLGAVVRNGTSNIANSIYKAADSLIDFTPLAPAKTIATIDYSNKGKAGKEVLKSAVDLLPYFNYKMITTPIKETDKIYKTISNNRGIHKISLATPKKGEMASSRVYKSKEQ